MAEQDMVHFKVGGERFQISRDYLLYDQESILFKMVDGTWNTLRDEDGCIIIDRDPIRFRVLTNFLRTRELVLDYGVTASGILQEASFFQLEELSRAAAAKADESDELRLLTLYVDERRGKLLCRRGEGEEKIPSKAGLTISLFREALVLVSLHLGKVSGFSVSIACGSDGKEEERPAVWKTEDSRKQSAMFRLSAGEHSIRLNFTARGSGAFNEIASVYGPLRLEVYPSVKYEWIEGWHDSITPEKVDKWRAKVQDNSMLADSREIAAAMSAILQSCQGE
ncbi:hypothetical protein GUITHDRAFT_112226 [Guillardia theta CCMP2712]|uniref:BTB domain-containing protein n=1 Tax=Guillardia theta (strain CCMP2712) TaxID=905079 RepID=L1IZX1_GUITC|nr:hypothetical protein GUITHDRAFT_112226 [Guillardia theta CCMP2712]EKX41808.1 hypothetical protein GUITHDRAFT_112226 [Guillardia theta CCMP2712]|eukprot:XP_005828788.1 hypothetical protein GUITHDRAFT_112226 [Guillardia theta CCMP2712]